jgi:hypothetical protein
MVVDVYVGREIRDSRDRERGANYGGERRAKRGKGIQESCVRERPQEASGSSRPHAVRSSPFSAERF